MSLNIVYNDDNLPVTMTMYCDMPLSHYQTLVENQYENGKLTGRRLTNTEKKTTEVWECSYSAEEYDEHGNWIKRDVTETYTNSAKPDKNYEKSFTETRTIKYY